MPTIGPTEGASPSLPPPSEAKVKAQQSKLDQVWKKVSSEGSNFFSKVSSALSSISLGRITIDRALIHDKEGGGDATKIYNEIRDKMITELEGEEVHFPSSEALLHK